MVDHFYGPQPWLAEDALILGTTPLCRYDQNRLLRLLRWTLLITFTLLGRLQSLAWALGPLYT